jgi:hypothetical protein
VEAIETYTEQEENFIAYPAPNGEPNQYIREYPSGKRVLVEIDPASGKCSFLRDL